MTSVSCLDELEIIFEDKLDAVVLYGLTGCKPCRTAKQTVLEYLQRNPEMKYFEVDIREVRCAGVRTVPILRLYKSGKCVRTLVGSDIWDSLH